MGPSQIVLAMTSLRIFPGSPNPVYNLIFPHIRGISLSQILLGAFFGQLPYNLCLAKAGHMLHKLRSTTDIVDVTTAVEFMLVSLTLMLPVLV